MSPLNRRVSVSQQEDVLPNIPSTRKQTVFETNVLPFALHQRLTQSPKGETFVSTTVYFLVQIIILSKSTRVLTNIPTQGKVQRSFEINDFGFPKFTSPVLQVHKHWILALSTTKQAWSAVLASTNSDPQRACGEHKAFYLSLQVEPSVSALCVKGITQKLAGRVKVQVGRPITVQFSMPTATYWDFPWSILIMALSPAAQQAHRFRLMKID